MASLKEQVDSGKVEVTFEGETRVLNAPEWMRAQTVNGLVEAVAQEGNWTMEKAEAWVLAQARQNIVTGFRAAAKDAWAGKQDKAGRWLREPAEFDALGYFPENAGQRTATKQEKMTKAVEKFGMTPEELLELAKKMMAAQAGK